MIYNSCFDIIGPIMVGPSSSHTAGVVAIGKFVHDFLGGVPERVFIVLYDSFAETYKGHGTDKAIVGGLIGMDTNDLRIRQAMETAFLRNMRVEFAFEETCPFFDHPNTVLIRAKRGNDEVLIGGVSLGGGISKICYMNGLPVNVMLNASYDLEQLKQFALEASVCGAVVRSRGYGLQNHAGIA
ncbi:hypothetical protein LSG31_15515 [Fodinisporobacter ferrooxydans]|uniref:L-serine ammonia-lyase n=1 Tax=Fodinisporobacter ferrooxydans TaxID=2901836 RepID=A0ABY4CIL7_9BACL|nr:hypothetical protein LSG31_15515 [Alicyclobacillaceae bacterium MYW30-H2]